jgi:hypothetical protein
MGMRGNGIVGLLVVRGEVTKMTASSEVVYGRFVEVSTYET